MIRQKPSAVMQKTYDECYLVCSTAVYFESQGNEAEALRSWRSALDSIYYFNAYRRPANWAPKTETEKALQASLRELELQCKERVDLLEALDASRKESNKSKDSASSGEQQASSGAAPRPAATTPDGVSWLGEGTIPPVDYPDLAKPPPLPRRPQLPKAKSSDGTRLQNPPPPSFPIPSFKNTARTSSRERKGRMLKTLRSAPQDGSKTSSSSRLCASNVKPPVAAKAATQAWTYTSALSKGAASTAENNSKETLSSSREVSARRSFDEAQHLNWAGVDRSAGSDNVKYAVADNQCIEGQADRKRLQFAIAGSDSSAAAAKVLSQAAEIQEQRKPPTPPYKPSNRPLPTRQRVSEPSTKAKSSLPPYRREYPPASENSKRHEYMDATRFHEAPATRDVKIPPESKPDFRTRRPDAAVQKAPISDSFRTFAGRSASPTSGEDSTSSERELKKRSRPKRLKGKARSTPREFPSASSPISSSETLDDTTFEAVSENQASKERWENCLKRLPKGVDEAAAKQIFNEIVIHGDEVHWDDVAGLEVAKSALKETVVYPFLRPDLFMGLREPAKGMLLFGPPGTGKTMLARAVATESRSTFFAISASSLTSKYLGESEKLVRALFQLAKALAPAIIFVDEIDSLLSSRSGSSEHEATRRIKTEFLVQWSDLARAAAGREQNEREKEKGDASRVLVLAATNLPWTIDEAARRRFVRRQYIPLPEDRVRKLQLQTLLSHQTHNISEKDLDRLVELTEGFSGSDITALAKDAAMGPLRSLGERLLQTTMEEIRPMQFSDFQASLANIRPSVSKQGLREYEDWAKEFGERGG